MKQAGTYGTAAAVVVAMMITASTADARSFRPPPSAPPAPVDSGTHFLIEAAGGMGMPVGTGTADMRTDLALKFGFGGMAGQTLRLYWLFGLEGEFASGTSTGDKMSGPVVTERTDTQVFTALRFLFPIAGNLRMFIDGGVGYGTSTVSSNGEWITASQETGYPLLYTAAGLQYRLFRALSIGTEVTYMDAIGQGATNGVLLEKLKDGVAAVKLTLTVHF